MDESRHAALVVASTDAASYTVTPTGEELRRDLGDFLRTHDEPVGSTSVYAQYRVMELASAHVKVVLDGQGGDEVFAGYEPYRSYVLMPWAVGAIGNTLRLYGFGRTVRHVFKAGVLLLPVGVKRWLWLRRNGPYLTVARAALGREFSAAYLDAVERWVQDLNGRLLLDITRLSLPQLLRWEDRNAMRFSVESRVPFCDHRLVEYVLQIPACYKVHAGWTKYILRLAVSDLLPEAIVWRRDKLGFATPEVALREALPEFHAAVARWKPLRGNHDFFWWRLFNVLWLANSIDRRDADDG